MYEDKHQELRESYERKQTDYDDVRDQLAVAFVSFVRNWMHDFEILLTLEKEMAELDKEIAQLVNPQPKEED